MYFGYKLNPSHCNRELECVMKRGRAPGHAKFKLKFLYFPCPASWRQPFSCRPVCLDIQVLDIELLN